MLPVQPRKQFPAFINQLVDAKLGPNGIYTVLPRFTNNMQRRKFSAIEQVIFLAYLAQRMGLSAFAFLGHENALKFHPDNKYLQDRYGLALQGRSGAYGLFEKVINTPKQATQGLACANVIYKAFILKNAGQYAEALKIINDNLAIFPDLAEMFTSRGIILHHMKKYEEALESKAWADYFKAYPLITQSLFLTLTGGDNKKIKTFLKTVNQDKEVEANTLFESFQAFDQQNTKGSKAKYLRELQNTGIPIGIRPDDSESVIAVTNNHPHKRTFSLTLETDNIDLSRQSIITWVDRQNGEQICQCIMAPQGFIFKGKSGDIHLNIKGKLNIPSLTMDHPNGNIKLKLEVDSEESFALVVNNVASLSLEEESTIMAQKQIALDTKGNFWIKRRTFISSQADISVAADALQCDGVILATDKMVVVVRTLEMQESGRLHGPNQLMIKADSLKDIRGQISSDANMLIELTDSVYLHGQGAIISGQIKLNAKSILATDKSWIYANDLIACFKEKVLIDKESEWYIKNNFYVQTNKAIISSTVPVKSDGLLFIHADDILTIHNKSKLKTDKLSLSGGRLWNAGRLRFKKVGSISFNREVVHGLAITAELWGLPNNAKDFIKDRPSIKGDGPLSIVAGAFIDIVSMITVHRLNLSAILEINALGVTQCNRKYKSRLLDFDYEVSIPNFPAIKKEIMKIISHVQHDEYAAIASEIITVENALAGVSIACCITRTLIPGLGLPIDIARSILMLVVNSVSLIQYCQQLSQMKRPIEFRDIIPILQYAKNIANQSVSMGMEASWLAETPNLSFAPSINHDALVGAAIDVVTILGPRFDSESLIDIHGGLHLNVTEQHQALVGMHVGGIEIAATSINRGLYLDNNGIEINHTQLIEAKEFQQQGTIVAKHFYLQTNEMLQQGNLISQDPILKMQQLQNTGEMTLNHAVIQATGPIENKGTMHLTETTMTAGVLSNTGHLILDETKVTVQQECLLSGQNDFSDTAIHAEDIRHSTNTTIQGEVLLEANNHLDLSGTMTGSGQLDLVGQHVQYHQPTIHTQGVLIDDPAFNHTQVDDFFHGSNAFKNVNAHDLGVITETPLKVDKAIHRDGDITIAAPSLTVTQEIDSHEKLTLIATKRDLIAQANLHGNTSLDLLSLERNVMTDKHHFSSEMINVHAKANYTNQEGDLHANNKITLTAETGNIKNTGGTIAADSVLQGVAGESVINAATQQLQWGGYDYVENYHPALMQGGKGNEESPGLNIEAGGKVINDASVMSAVGDIQIKGNKGVEVTARTHQYKSYEHTSHGSFFGSDKKTVVYDTQVQPATIISIEGANVIHSQAGKIHTEGANIIAKNGSDLYAKDAILLYDIKGLHSVDVKKSGLFGLNPSHHHETQDTSSPTILANIDPELIRIHSNESDIVLKASYIYNPGRTELFAKNIYLTSSILHSHTTDETQGLVIKIGDYTLIGPSSSSKSLFNPDPLWTDATQLVKSHHPAELLINEIQLSLDSVNSIYAFTNGLKHNTLIQTFAQRQSLYTMPTLKLGYYHHQTENNSTSLATGGITTGDLSLKASMRFKIEGMPINVANDMAVTANQFDQEGITLRHDMKHNEFALSVSPSTHGPLGMEIEVNTLKQIEERTEISPQQINVGGTLEVTAQNWQVNSGQTIAGQLTGKVDKLSLTSKLDSKRRLTENIHVSTTGDIGFHQAECHQTQINTKAILKVLQATPHHALAVNSAELLSGELSAPDVHPEKLTLHTLHTEKKSHQCGLSFNAINPLPSTKQAPSLIEKDLPIKLACQFSQAVYQTDAPLQMKGYDLMNRFSDEPTGSVAEIYMNPNNKTVFVSFQGTENLAALFTDDVDIAFGGEPRSADMDNPFSQKIATTIREYQQKDYTVCLTGHSRGAAVASLFSDLTGATAIVFDNPGIHDPHHQYDFSQVISMESSYPNLINHLGEATGRYYNQGEIIPLNPSTSTQVINLAGQFLQKTSTGLPALGTMAGLTLWSHRLDHMGQDIDQQLNREENAKTKTWSY